MKRTILVTGAAGFVGRHLLASAAKEDSINHWVGTDLPDVDLADPQATKNLLEQVKPDTIVHLAGWLGKGEDPENRTRLLRGNVDSTWNLLQDADKLEQFLLVSTGLVYGDQPGPFYEDMQVQPPDDYSLTKQLAEDILKGVSARTKMRACIVRPAILYGPGQKGPMFIPSLVRAIKERTHFAMTAGEQLRDFLHVSDFVRALLELVKSYCQGIYNTGTSKGEKLCDVAQMAFDMAGCPELQQLGALPYREHESWQYALYAKKIRQDCGWQPRVSLSEGLKELLQNKE